MLACPWPLDPILPLGCQRGGTFFLPDEKMKGTSGWQSHQEAPVQDQFLVPY